LARFGFKNLEIKNWPMNSFLFSFKFLENLKTCYEKKSKIHPKANLVVHQIIVGVKNVVGGKDNKNR
jgi:hypothetical protein